MVTGHTRVPLNPIATGRTTRTVCSSPDVHHPSGVGVRR
ncbi:hypothetical protein GJR88_02710 [Dietzia sp. DQ12-45-1b]|nr:hypothetical protein GJR88_02710 [Dietzia sp. DQ12-45-1b]